MLTQLPAEAVLPDGASLDLWWGGSDFREVWLGDYRVYWAKYIDIKIPFRQYQEALRRLLVSWHKVEVLAVPPARRHKIFVSIPGSWSRYDTTSSLHVLIQPVFSYYTGIYRNCAYEKDRLDIIVWTENALMTMGSLLEAV